MSLLQKASIITTPTAYAEDYLYSIKPVYALGNEKVSSIENSPFYPFNTFTDNGGGSYTCISTSTSWKGFQQPSSDTFAVTISQVYRITFDCVINSGTHFQFFIGNDAVGSAYTPVTTISATGSYSFDHTVTISNSAARFVSQCNQVVDFTISNISIVKITDADFRMQRSSTATRVNEEGLIEEVAINTPRIDFTGGTGSILLEPSSTNLITYSEDFNDSSWVKSGVGTGSTPSVISNYSISPDGTQNADRVVFDLNGGTANGDVSQVSVSFGTVSSSDYTNSVYIKSNTTNDYDVVVADPSGGHITNNITPQWQRFEATRTGVTNLSIRIRLRGDESTSDYADVSIWGAQVEEVAYATSYIPTNGSTQTRAVDNCNNAGNSDLISSTEGTLYLESKSAIETISGYNYYIALSDGTSSNRLEIRQTGANLQFLWRVGGAYQSQIISSGIQLTNFNKIALKYSSSEISYWINENEIGTISTPTLFSANTLTELAFDDGGGGNPFQGNAKMVAVFKEALTDEELTKLTS